MDRQHRRELKHDKFVDELGTLSSRARDNQRLLLALTAGLVVISIIVYGFFFYRSDRERKAQALLGTSIETIDSLGKVGLVFVVSTILGLVSGELETFLTAQVQRKTMDELLDVATSVRLEAYESPQFFDHLKRVETNGWIRIWRSTHETEKIQKRLC